MQAGRGSSAWWTSATARIVLVLGLAYVASWWSYQRFYEPFRAAPQDVGLNPTGGLGDIIGAVLRLGLWLTVALLGLALLPALSVACLGYLVDVCAPAKRGRGFKSLGFCLRESVKKQPTRIIVASLLGLAAGSLALATYAVLLGYFALAPGIATLAAVCIWAYVAGLPPASAEAELPAGETERPGDQAGAHGQPLLVQSDEWSRRAAFRSFVRQLDYWWDARRTPISWALNLFAALALIGLFFLDLPEDASNAAICARAGHHAVRGIGAPLEQLHIGLQLVLLDVQAQPATISWISGTAPGSNMPASFEGVYLGSADGFVVVYRQSPTRTLLRIPASSVQVAIKANAQACKASHEPTSHH